MKWCLLFCLMLCGCTDSDLSKIMALGKPGDIVCYSGGRVIYQGRSTGIIQSLEKSDGWEFRDATTHRLVRVSGQCVIKN